MGSTGTIHWQLWSNSWRWSRKTPKWRDGQWNPITALLGKWEYSNEPRDKYDVLIPMPERAYPATVTLEEATWRRSRFPFLRRSVQRANIDIPDGIGTPGKGENAWDVGDDATFGMTCPASTVEQAIATVVESVLHDRIRRSGRLDFTPTETAAD
jgi:hypothetical protein